MCYIYTVLCFNTALFNSEDNAQPLFQEKMGNFCKRKAEFNGL